MAAEGKDVEKAIQKQIEFYFSNSNLPKDKFLLQLTKDNDGWAPIATIATFKKIRALTTDVAAIVQALRGSPSLIVNEAGTMVKRASEIPDKINDLLTAATVYAKGFPEDATIESIEAVFAPFGKVKCVRLRRYKDKSKQKDSCFVEFDSEEEAKNIVTKSIPSPLGADKNLILMTKTAYMAKKSQEIAEKRKKKGGKKAEKTEKTDNSKDEEAKEEKAEEPVEIKLDLILRIKGLSDQTTREEIKAYLAKLGGVTTFIEFKRGQTDGFVRLQETSAKASEIVKAAGGSTEKIQDKTPTLEAVTGEEEQKYWQALLAAKKSKGGRGGKGGRGRGRGRGGGRGGRGGRGGKRKDESDSSAGAEPKPEQGRSKKVKLSD